MSRSVAISLPAWRTLKETLRRRFPGHWRRLQLAKAQAIAIPTRFLQKRLIKKGAAIYLGANDEDKWVIEDVFHGKRDGFFIELGAHNGIDISNTYILEKCYGWRGICIEPDPKSFSKLIKERSCICVQACVDGTPRKVRYLYDGARGGIIDADTDIKPDAAKRLIDAAQSNGRLATVQTKTLGQILRENNAPTVIDFFSFDVEGAETRILRDFDFDEYRFNALIVERASEELNEILFRNGYRFVELRVGDTFYVHESVPSLDSIPKKPFKQVPPKPAPLEINFVKKPMSLRSAISALFL